MLNDMQAERAARTFATLLGLDPEELLMVTTGDAPDPVPRWRVLIPVVQSHHAMHIALQAERSA